MLEAVLPDLTFPQVDYALREVPRDLRWMLYRGANTTQACFVSDAIAQGKLGPPLLARLPLLQLIHAHLEGKLAEGGSKNSLARAFQNLRRFYAFVDGLNEGKGESPTIESAERLLRMYGEQLRRARNVNASSRYDMVLSIARCLSRALGKPVKRLLRGTRIHRPRTASGSRKADKQSLADVSAFIRFLRELCAALSRETVLGPIPAKLAFSDGSSFTMRGGFIYGPDHDGKQRPRAAVVVSGKRRRRTLENRSLEVLGRSQLANLRIEAELLIFIHQTAANLTQSRELANDAWSFQSRHGYLEMTAFKGRAEKTVSFRVYPEYRHHFDAYRTWRNGLFPADETRLFPLVMSKGGSPEFYKFYRLRQLLRALKRDFFPPSLLRRSHGNWKERREAGRGHRDLGNSASVFDKHYREPNHQRALVEINRYWKGRKKLSAAAGAGGCVTAAPTLQQSAPSGAPQPDCSAAAGCAFCEHNRDLESFDHVWNLVSLRSLAKHELTLDATPGGRDDHHPKFLLIERIGAKLAAFRALGDLWTKWVDEAEKRASAEHYHPIYTEQWDIIVGPRETP